LECNIVTFASIWNENFQFHLYHTPDRTKICLLSCRRNTGARKEFRLQVRHYSRQAGGSSGGGGGGGGGGGSGD
jgi:uncharacterized membrane protein YgcG